MATKWKNFTRNSWVKAVCWLLIFVMTAVSAGMTVYAAENAQKNNLNDLSSYSTYSLSDILIHEHPTAEYLAQQLYFPISNLYTVGENGTTEENVEKNVTPADLLGELTSEYYQSDTWESGESEQSYDASPQRWTPKPSAPSWRHSHRTPAASIPTSRRAHFKRG